MFGRVVTSARLAPHEEGLTLTILVVPADVLALSATFGLVAVFSAAVPELQPPGSKTDGQAVSRVGRLSEEPERLGLLPAAPVAWVI